MDSESEMMSDLAAADAAGDTELASHIAGKIKAGRAQPTEQPGVLRRALAWAATPSRAMQPIIDQNKAQADAAGPSPGARMLGAKDETQTPDWYAGAQRFASGLPGFQPSSMSGAADARQEQFGAKHPALGAVLPLVAGFANPILPTGPASGAGGATERLANTLAARTLRGTATEYKTLGKQGVQDVGDFLLRNKAVRFGSSPAAVAERASVLPQSTGQALGKSIEALDATGGQVSKRVLAQRFMDLAEEAKSGGPGAAPLVAKYEGAADSVLKDIQSSGEPMMSFKQAEQWKQAYQAPINYAKQTNTPLEMGAKEVASAARQGVEDAAGVAGPGTEVGEQFMQAKKESGLAQQAARMAKGAEGRRMGRNMSSPTSRATSLLGVTTALASGHPGAALPALVAGPALEQLLKRSPAAAAVILKSIAPGASRTVLQGGGADAITFLRDALRRRAESAAQPFASNE